MDKKHDVLSWSGGWVMLFSADTLGWVSRIYAHIRGWVMHFWATTFPAASAHPHYTYWPVPQCGKSWHDFCWGVRIVFHSPSLLTNWINFTFREMFLGTPVMLEIRIVTFLTPYTLPQTTSTRFYLLFVSVACPSSDQLPMTHWIKKKN